MNTKKLFVFLQVETWAGMGIGAEHYYGSLQRGENEDVVDLEYILSDEDARRLNEKENIFGELVGLPILRSSYRAGQKSKQFFSQEDVVKAAKAQWRHHFPGAEFLVFGYSYVLDPQPVIDGNLTEPRIIKLNKMVDERKNLRWEKKEDRPTLEKHVEECIKIMKSFEAST